MATTKDQLLKYFQGLDVPTLEKLKKYSTLLIIPDEDLLVNATMTQMVEKAHSLADSLFPEWTDRSKSDFGEFLVELFALFSEKDFWYINAFANEGILRKMRSYGNAFSKVSSLGYYPVTCKGSSATFNVTFEAGEETTYERGDLIVEVDGMYFTNDSSFKVDKASTEITKSLTLYEGSSLAEDVTYNGYSVLIRKENIDLDSINVSINNVDYTRVNNFGFSSSDSTHFMVLPEEDGSCSIFFGNNGFGVQPSIGTTVHVECRLCNGSDGNIDINEASINDSLSERSATEAVMSTASTGGLYPESLTSIKEKAPTYFNNRRSIINETTAEEALMRFSFVKKAKVLLVGKEVTYRIIPTSGRLEPTASELATISEEFDPYLMAGYQGVYTANTYRNLILSANPDAQYMVVDTIISPGYDTESISNSIIQIIQDITNPLISAEYGGSFSKSKTDLLIRSNISGVQSTSFFVRVGTEDVVMPDVALEDSEIFKPIDKYKVLVRTHVI